MARAIAALTLVILAGPAAAGSEPNSSASISITVSVTPRFGLGTGGQAVDGAAAPFCIATNGTAARLPILLIGAGQGTGSADALPQCDVKASAAGLGEKGQRHGPADGLLIVRPE